MDSLKSAKLRPLVILLNFILVTTVVTTVVREGLSSHTAPGLVTLSLSVFASYLFFIMMPVELLFVFYVAEGAESFPVLLGLTLISAMAAQTLDYSFGRVVKQTTLDELIGIDRFKRVKLFFEKHGLWTVFLFNLFPLSSPLVLLLAGMARFPAKTVMLISLLGLAIKYLVLGFVTRTSM